MHPVTEAALTYAALGLSVIPVNADKSPTGHHWAIDDLGESPAQRRIAEESEIATWYRYHPDRCVGVVCGRVSGGLAVLDMDDQVYSAWIVEHMGSILERTWAVQTGSGKIHVYLRTSSQVSSRVVHYDGIKRAEIRFDGQYVLAPPSAYDFGGVQGAYVTLCGGPDRIWAVKDADAIFRRLIQTVGDRLGERGANGHHPESPQLVRAAKTILPPLGGDERDLLRAEIQGLRMHSRTTRAILEGPDENEGDWTYCRTPKGDLDHSDIDFHVVCSLVESGVPDEKIELIYATFPIGEGCYRNVRRSNHGAKYLEKTLTKARKSQTVKAAAAVEARGENFEIVDVVRVLTEPPSYDITMVCPDGQTRLARGISSDATLSESEFVKAVHRELGFRPEVNAAHRARDFKRLTHLIDQMAKTERPAVGSVESDYLRTVVLDHLRAGLLIPEPPDDPSLVTVGWRDEGRGYAYIHSAALIQRIAASFRGPSPKADKLWDALRSVGIAEDIQRNDEGRVARLWKLPLDAIDRGG